MYHELPPGVEPTKAQPANLVTHYATPPTPYPPVAILEHYNKVLQEESRWFLGDSTHTTEQTAAFIQEALDQAQRTLDDKTYSPKVHIEFELNSPTYTLHLSEHHIGTIS